MGMQFRRRGGNWEDEPREKQRGGCSFILHLKICDSTPRIEKKKENGIFIAIFSKNLFSHYSFLESKFSRGIDRKGWEIPTRKGSGEHNSKKGRARGQLSSTMNYLQGG